MRRSIVFATPVWQPLPGLTLAAERAGFSRVWTTEGPRRDAIARAAALAASSSTIGVGTGISFAFGRSPLSSAGSALDIGLLSNGRFTLGLGAGTRGVRRQYGVDIDRPAPWFEDYVAVIREAFDAEATSVAWKGPYFQVDLPAPKITSEHAGAPYQSPPIYGAALNPIMIKRVAKVCDGLALLSIGMGGRYFEDTVLPAFRAGRAEAGKSPEGGFACWCITSVDDDGDRARALAKQQLAFYFSTPSYARPAEALGFQQAANDIRDAARAPGPTDWEGVASLVPDSMIEALCLAGTPTEVGARIGQLEARLEAAGVDELALQLPGGGLDPKQFHDACSAVIETCGPAGRKESTK
jgi:alkanesulfonate monooxygenase SsuD/methylene tetrahydromethanopterin reductase-like flavin-dependent oxidoreductase (luciferase family)